MPLALLQVAYPTIALIQEFASTLTGHLAQIKHLALQVLVPAGEKHLESGARGVDFKLTLPYFEPTSREYMQLKGIGGVAGSGGSRSKRFKMV